MANIKKMEMASELFQKDFIRVETKLLGLSTQITYIPTNSPLKGKFLEYDPSNGDKVQKIIESSANGIDKILEKEGSPKTSPNGNYLLEIAYSTDKFFVALYLLQFSGFSYHPVGELHFAKNEEASKLIDIFV